MQPQVAAGTGELSPGSLPLSTPVSPNGNSTHHTFRYFVQE
jgi:hypothetical protein